MKLDVSRRTLGVNFKEEMAEVVVWSPGAQQVHIRFGDHQMALQKNNNGYWTKVIPELKEGDFYKLMINREKEFPDPASVWQPVGVHGHSMALDISKFEWADHEWKNIPLQDYILYELHTGTFTPEGTFEAIESKLSHLQELGINAIEIMPVSQFPGERNWGYDGVYPFAVQHSYGGPKGLKHLVNTCHQKGIAVILDVVYNHLGPEGNYLGEFGPYTTGKYQTPWGGAINFDDEWCDGVRKYFIENALMWFRDFHIDALRLDAVHAIRDFGPKHILQEIREHVDELMRSTGRKHYLIAELDLNDNRYINPIEKAGYGMDAQWIDEFHHALRVTASNERTGYYSDFNGIEHLAKAYTDAYVYDGQFSLHRKKHFGVKTNNPGHQFIVFSQNHDQVGNRMLGERTSRLLSFEMQKLVAAAVMVSPYLPMIFMGEEWSESNPFLYFVSHTDPELAEAVRKGRREEFAAFHHDSIDDDTIEPPDPVSKNSFLQSKLQWEKLNDEPHYDMMQYYKELISLRKTHPALKIPDRKQLLVEADKEKKTLVLHRWSGDQHLVCFMNFSAKQQYLMPPSMIKDWVNIFDSASQQWKGPQSAPGKISGGQPGNPALTMQPESIVIYAGTVPQVN